MSRSSFHRILGVLGLLAGMAAPAAGAGAPAPDTSWTALLLRDLDAARGVIAADHPGVVDAENPGFRRTLEAAAREALAAAPDVRSFDAYRVTLTRFVNRFRDQHLQIGFTRGWTRLGEAGLYSTWRGGSFFVTGADTVRYGARAASWRGARILSCDGVPAESVFAHGLLSWNGRREIAADWYRLGALLLVDYGPPTPPAPKRCVLELAGRRVTVALQWREVTPTELSARIRSFAPSAPPPALGLRRVDEDTWWVGLPTFAPADSLQLAAMHATIGALHDSLAHDRSWQLLVFDLRGNEGGSSEWADEILGAVFGEDWKQQALRWLYDGVATEWRVSPDNRKAAEGNVRQSIERHGADSPSARDARALVDSLDAALARGDSLWGAPRPRSGAPKPPASSVPGRIVVVTTASCYSACLDFMDRMRLHPAVIQVGQPTGADTNYMENWGTTLPGGLVQIGYPMKVYRNRRRGSNVPYEPDVRYDGPMSDTAALERWIFTNWRSWKVASRGD